MALALTWGGYADTDIRFSEFFGSDHTVAVRALFRYPRAYHGPIVSVHGQGRYLIGQGDWKQFNPRVTNLVVRVGDQVVELPTPLEPTHWRHLALVRKGSQFQLYLDGKKLGAPLGLPTDKVPDGVVRLGKQDFRPVDGGGAQFYGLIDDFAVFDSALSDAQIALLAAHRRLLGTEVHLLAGHVFGHQPAGGLPARLARPLVRTETAFLAEVSDNRNGLADLAHMPLPQCSHMRLPFPRGEVWRVAQGFCGDVSHNGYAAFCWDFVRDGAITGSGGAPFYACAGGTVDSLRESEGDAGNTTNFVTVRQEFGELCDYLHLKKDTVGVTAGSTVGTGAKLAEVGASGTKGSHLHLAFTTIGEGHKDEGPRFITYPAAFSNYEVQDANGDWQRVIRGIPEEGQKVRRPSDEGPLRYSVAWRRGQGGEYQMYGVPYAEYRARYDALWPDGWRLAHLEVVVHDGVPRYTAVWRPVGNKVEYQLYGALEADFQARLAEHAAEGRHLVLLSVYFLDGKRRYTAVWREVEVAEETRVLGNTYEQYRARYDALWPDTWRLHLLNVHVEHDVPRYTAVWRKANEHEIQEYGRTYETYRARYNALWKDGWRLKHLCPYVVDGQTRYTAVWRPGGEEEYQVYGWSYQEVRARYDVLWHKGWRLKLISPYVL